MNRTKVHNSTSEDLDTKNYPLVNLKNNKNSLDLLNDEILNLNTEKLYKDYFSDGFNGISLIKFENMHNDMKIILKIIEAEKTQINFNKRNNPTQTQQNFNNNSEVNVNYSHKENGINMIDL